MAYLWKLYINIYVDSDIFDKGFSEKQAYYREKKGRSDSERLIRVSMNEFYIFGRNPVARP